MFRWNCLLLSVLLLGAAPAARADDSNISNEQITAAVKKAVAWIYAQQNDWGTWETAKEPAGVQRDRLDQGQFGEVTALAMHALLAAGESGRDPQLQKAIQFLITDDRIAGVYAVGMRAQVWAQLAPEAAIRQAMAQDRATLLAAMHRSGRTRGLFSYRTDFEGEPNYADHEVSLYGTMGVKALADGGIEVPDDFWRTVDRAWRSQQQRDGSWVLHIGSSRGQQHTMSMTAGGVAVLFSTSDELAAAGNADCRGVPADRNIQRGLDWIDAHFDQSRQPQQLGEYTVLNYGLYAIARIGVISGRKYFNQRDWYQDGARMLLDAQDPGTGAWGNLPDTCLAILFLVRGRNPVVLSKLQHGDDWDLRPRDVANVTDWVGRQVEMEYRWQTVGLQVPVDELHDSSVLYVSGNKALKFSDEEKRKLRDYMLEGGLVLGVADCASEDFSDSFRSLGEELFPDYEFRNVPRDSVIYTGEEYRAADWPRPPELMELSNGVRDLMLLIPQGDPGRHFQLKQVGSWRRYYELLGDIIFYSVDKDGMRLKGDTYLVRPDPAANVKETLKIARLEYDGNWDPEPAGWRRLAAVMHNERGIDLNVTAIRAGEGKLDSSFAMAHLTGTGAFHLSSAARDEIQKYVNGGGTLAIDAAGGNAAFAADAENQIKQMFPDGSLEPVLPEELVFSAGMRLSSAHYRRFARLQIGSSSDFRLQGLRVGNRIAVFFSGEDLSAGLVGEPIDGVYGYTSSTATNLMANLITYAAGK